jgi:hypothetical protein
MIKGYAAILALALPACAAAQTYTGNRCSSGDAGSSTCVSAGGSSASFATLTAGALVVVVVRVPNTTTTVTGITGCGSGWARAFSQVTTAERNETWYAFNLGAIACAPVPTWSAADPGARMAGVEIGGISTTAPLDKTSTSTSTGLAFTSGATAALAQSANMAIGTCANNNYQTTGYTATGGYTTAHPVGGLESAGNRIYIAYRVTTTTAAETFTASGDSSTLWSCGVAVFKATGGGGGSPTPRMLTLGVGGL